MPTQCIQTELDLGRSGGRKLVGAFDGGAITSNGGVVLLGAADTRSGSPSGWRPASPIIAMPRPSRTTLLDLLRQRIFGLALGYEDLIDHDALRFDPALAAVHRQAGRRACRQVDAQPTGARRQDRPGPPSQARPRRGRHRAAVRRSVPGRPSRAADRASSSISMRPMIRSTASRKVGTSTATTTAIATCRSTSSAAVICLRPSSDRRAIDAADGATDEVARIVGSDPRALAERLPS